MRLPSLPILALALVVALSIPSGAADYCTVYDAEPEATTPATGVSASALEVGGEDPGIYYLDLDACEDACLLSVWVFEETNGVPGLQRQDHVTDGCPAPEADTVVF